MPYRNIRVIWDIRIEQDSNSTNPNSEDSDLDIDEIIDEFLDELVVEY